MYHGEITFVSHERSGIIPGIKNKQGPPLEFVLISIHYQGLTPLPHS